MHGLVWGWAAMVVLLGQMVAAAAQTLEIEGLQHQDGAVSFDAERSHRLTLTNRGSSTVTVSLFDRSCDCLSISVDGQPLAPLADRLPPEAPPDMAFLQNLRVRGAASPVVEVGVPGQTRGNQRSSGNATPAGNAPRSSIEIKPGATRQMQLAWNVGRLPGKYRYSCRILTTDPAEPLFRVEIAGQVQPPVEVFPADLDLSKATAAAPAYVTIYSKSYDLRPAVEPNEDCPLATRIEKTTALPPGVNPCRSAFRIALWPKEPLPLGLIDSALQIQTGVELQPDVEVPLWGRRTDKRIEFMTDDSLIFPDLPPRESAERKLCLALAAPLPVEAAAFCTDIDFLQCSVESIAAGPKRTLLILSALVPPEAPPGSYEGTIEVQISKPALAPLRIPVTLSVHEAETDAAEDGP